MPVIPTTYPLPTNNHSATIPPGEPTNQTGLLLCPAVHPQPEPRRPSILAGVISDALPIHLALHLHGNKKTGKPSSSSALFLYVVSVYWYGMDTCLCYYKLAYVSI